MRKLFSNNLGKSTIKDGQKKLKDGDLTITGKIVRFSNPSGTETRDSFGSTTDTNIEFYPVKLDKLNSTPNVMRKENDGKIKVYCKLQIQPKAITYIKYWAPIARQGHYKGEFKKILDFVDENNNVVDHVWYTLANENGKTCLINLKLWNNANVPPNLVEGSEIDISGSFGCYLDVKEPTFGFRKNNTSVSKDEEIVAKDLALNTTHIPEVHEEAVVDMLNEVEVSFSSSSNVPKIAPYIRFGMTSNTGVFFSKDNVDCSALESFSSEVDNRRHFLEMPKDIHECFAFVVPMSEYQADLENPEDCEVGPSTGRAQRISFDMKDNEKPPKGVSAELTTNRESKKTVDLFVTQYGSRMTEDDLPYLLEFTIYQGDVIKTGITHREHWLKFGRIPWHGIAVVNVDTKTTLNLAINKQADARIAGKLECWLKNVFFDVPSTCRTYGIKVNKNILLSKLYADVYVDANKTSGERMLFIQMDKLGKRSENGFTNNPLHVKGTESDAINLGEWTSDAGFVLTNDLIDLYVLLYIPIKQDLLINGEVNEDEASKYVEDCTSILKNIKDEEMLVKVLLGEEIVPELELYHPEEIEMFNSLKPPQRALVLPGRGPKKNIKYPKKAPKTFGFDFLVYAIKREKQPVVREQSPQKKDTTNKSKKKNPIKK
jgi:hypothetical protein